MAFAQRAGPWGVLCSCDNSRRGNRSSLPDVNGVLLIYGVF